MMGPRPGSPTARGRMEQQGPHLHRRTTSRRGGGSRPSPTASCPGCCPGTGSWPAASSSCAGAWTPGSSPPARRWGHSEGGLSVGGRRAEPGQQGAQALPEPPPPPPRLTLGTKPGATFFSLRSCHSTPARDGAACMSWRLDARCLGSTVRSWNGAHVRPCLGPTTRCPQLTACPRPGNSRELSLRGPQGPGKDGPDLGSVQ